MKVYDKKSMEYLVNLLSEFILSKIPSSEDSIIEVIYVSNFFVVNGSTTSKSFLDFSVIKDEFVKEYDELIKSLENISLNFLDVIKYEKSKIKEHIVFEFNEEDFPYSTVKDEMTLFSVLSVKSEFPYGFSLNYDRLLMYYLQYVSSHLFKVTGASKIKYVCSRNLFANEINLMSLESDSIYPDNSILSMVLDIFDFNLNNFYKTKMGEYSLIKDITHSNEEKPWLVRDKTSELILF